MGEKCQKYELCSQIGKLIEMQVQLISKFTEV